MKKLKLNLDTVAVLSFPTTLESDVQQGTVAGNMASTTISIVTDSRRGTSVCCETRWDDL